MKKWIVTLMLLAGSAVLTRFIPFSSYFRTLDTMIHEFGHALLTLLFSGKVLRIDLNPDHSGVTYSMIASNWSGMIVTLGGYTIASAFAVLMFYLYSKRQEKAGLIIISTIALLLLLLYVHQGFGQIWLLSFIVVNGIAYMLGQTVRSFYYMLLCFLTLEESVVGPFSLTLTALTAPAQAGDAYGMQQSTGITAALWALLFFGFSLVCARTACGYFFRRLRIGRPSARESGIGMD
ncbi:M50 family metallopeptidase [Paenibacillus tarimensis]